MNSRPQRRRSIRLQGYDYTQPGAYFVTVVSWHREPLFGEIEDGAMSLSLAGQCAATVWQALARQFPVQVGDWVIMPNHLHGILVIVDDDSVQRGVGAKHLENIRSFPPRPSSRCFTPTDSTPRGTVRGSLAAMMQNFKSVSARKINAARGTPGAPVWQRNYYEHIIRNERDWDTIRRYIEDNPHQWTEDELHR